MSLYEYVKYRNGVPLGAKGSLPNMLKRSMGASSFKKFWQHWNPVWGYYLLKLIYQPIFKITNRNIAVCITFAVSGLIHDVIISIIKGNMIFVVTPWFFAISIFYIILECAGVTYEKVRSYVRTFINCSLIIICYLISVFVMKYIY